MADGTIGGGSGVISSGPWTLSSDIIRPTDPTDFVVLGSWSGTASPLWGPSPYFPLSIRGEVNNGGGTVFAIQLACDDPTAAPETACYRSGGTIANPTAVLSGFELGDWGVAAFDGTMNRFCGNIAFVAASDFAGGAPYKCDLVFQLQGPTPIEVLRLRNDGSFAPGIALGNVADDTTERYVALYKNNGANNGGIYMLPGASGYITFAVNGVSAGNIQQTIGTDFVRIGTTAAGVKLQGSGSAILTLASGVTSSTARGLYWNDGSNAFQVGWDISVDSTAFADLYVGGGAAANNMFGVTETGIRVGTTANANHVQGTSAGLSMLKQVFVIGDTVTSSTERGIYFYNSASAFKAGFGVGVDATPYIDIYAGGATAGNIQLNIVDGLVTIKEGFKVVGNLGVFNTTPVSQQTVTGNRLNPESALKNLLTAVAAYGIIIDSTTAT